jgi:hypothetical protein
MATPQWIVGIALVLVPVAVAVLSLAPWYRRATAATLAAQEAARVGALAPAWDDAVRDATQISARITTAACGAPCGSLTLATGPEGFVRGGTVRAAVVIEMPAVVVPGFGSVGAFPYRVDHVEAIDLHRSFP